ncbi:MAG: MFS transporter [Candidatus Dormibacteraeota bacterium]|nr:MFS transporter [Candidatus Dormibacteraeota bacterium]
MTRRSLLLGLAGAGLFVAALDAYLVVTLLPAMISDVGLTIDRFEQATPIVTGFLCGYVIAMPLLGAYSDVRGRAPVYAICMAVFAAGSAVTATAGLLSLPGLPWLVAGRLLQGLGGGGLVPLSLALAADLYRDERRAIALGAVSALQEAGSVFGPLYGATLAAAASALGGWRFVFWLNLPLAAVCATGLVIASRDRVTRSAAHVIDNRTNDSSRTFDNRVSEATRTFDNRVSEATRTFDNRVSEATRTFDNRVSEATRTFDWKSAVLLGTGLGLFVVALYPDDPTSRATSGLFIPLGSLSLILLGLYGWRQVRSLEPLIPRQLLRSGRFIGAVVANLLIGAALMVALVDVPILGRLVFNQDQLSAGLLLTQFLLGVPIGAVVGGLLADGIGARPTAVIGMLCSAAAFLQMSGWHAGELAVRVGPIRPADIALGACGLGFGIVIAPLTAAVLELTRTQNHGLASSLVVLARVMGMLIGLSTLTAFGLFRFRQILGTPRLNDPDVRARVDHLARLVAAAFLQEYREIFTIAAGLCILAAAVVLVTMGRDSSQPPAVSPAISASSPPR